MKNKTRILVAIVCLSLFSTIPLASAQPASGPGLNPPQQGIIAIAAFTANGNAEKWC